MVFDWQVKATMIELFPDFFKKVHELQNDVTFDDKGQVYMFEATKQALPDYQDTLDEIYEKAK